MGALFLSRLIPPTILSFLGAYHIPLIKQRITPATHPMEKPLPKSSMILQGQGCYLIAMSCQTLIILMNQQHTIYTNPDERIITVQKEDTKANRIIFCEENVEEQNYVYYDVIFECQGRIVCIIIQMQKRPIGYLPGKPSVLDVKVQKTNKYDHVESKLAGKTGTTVKDIEFMSNKQASKKKGELFRRIKASTLWKLINQQQKVESIYEWNKPEEDARSQISNFTSVTIKTEQLPVGLQTDFLLIDLREPDEYEKYHIREALNFPGTHIKRDKYIPQLYNYKNKEGKVIVMYHFDEKPGIQYVTQLCEKGFENILLLNGGIEGFGQEIQEGLEGKQVPQFAKKQQVKKFKKTRLQ